MASVGCRLSCSHPRWAAALVAGVFILQVVTLPRASHPQVEESGSNQAQTSLPSIEEKTTGMERIDGFFPLYWDEATGRLWMEISRLDTEVLHMVGMATGLGSNDIGIDRGQLGTSRIVKFQRIGPKLLMIQPNYRFRSQSEDPAEAQAVAEAFAPSVLWGFAVGAEATGRVLVDLTGFLLRDANNLGARMRPGSYRFDESRSAVFLPRTEGFPKNTEMEVLLTFTRQSGGSGAANRGGSPGGRSFEGVGNVAASAEAATLRVHHSLVELPNDAYEPRPADPRAGYGSIAFADYSAALGEPMTKRFLRRHRLEKVDPSAELSDPVKPIVYYLDPGTPEPIRSALLEGARWWDQAFEAAGYRNAFRVEIRPPEISSHDVRYNVINWVHRSTRGWSTGGSVTDPRSGEILKGVVTLGSLRVRQDYMIAEGLLAPYVEGSETPPELARWALARIRQLSAHEVGHTLGLSHNYYNSRRGRISVLDYPHPLVTLEDDGSLDSSQVYASGIGDWDRVAIAYGYQDFPAGTDQSQALAEILDRAWGEDLRFMTNQDLAVHPGVDQWANGTQPGVELDRLMEVRRIALERFGERAIQRGRPMATLEDVLVPLYLHHRYQVTSAASALGGLHYVYALRGDGREPVRPVAAGVQRQALRALLDTLRPAELVIPRSVVERLPPRPADWRHTRELFPRYTGSAFDTITPAVVAARHTLAELLNAERAARLIEQHALNASLPGLEEVLEGLLGATFGASFKDSYEAEVKRAVERVTVEGLLNLAARAPMPQARALASHELSELRRGLLTEEGASSADGAHYAALSRDIQRFLERPSEPWTPQPSPAPPPGAPIGQPAQEWIWEWKATPGGVGLVNDCSSMPYVDSRILPAALSNP